MSLSVRKRKGSKYWQIEGSVCGVRVRRSSGLSRKGDAEALARRIEREIEEEAILGPDACKTFAEATMVYLRDNGEARFLKPIVERIGEMKLRDVKQSTLTKLWHDIYPNCKPSTVKRQLFAPVNAIMRLAAKNEWCDTPNFQYPRGYADQKDNPRWLPPEEIEIIKSTCLPHVGLLIDAFVGMGLRESDMLTFDWDNTYLDHGQVRAYIHKDDAWYWFDLQPRAIEALSNQPAREGIVLRNYYGEPYKLKKDSGGALHSLWQRASARSKVEKFSSHDLRHTWATYHYAMHRDLLRLQHDGKWSERSSVDRYAHLAPPDLRDRLIAHGWTMEPKGKESEKMEKIAI